MDRTYFDSVEYLIHITIAIVYVVLMSLIVDRILGYEKMTEDCKYRSLSMDATPAEREANERHREVCDQRKDEYEDKRFSHMMILGVASMIVGGYLVSMDESYSTIGSGIAFGGTFGVLYTSFWNWHKITTDLKILMLSVAFLTLGYGSVRLYNYEMN